MVMNVQIDIQNIGKIQQANIKFDGITVICGENNTGKSTVGKILFSCFNAMCNFEDKMKAQRKSEIRSVLRKNLLPIHRTISYPRLDREYESFLEANDENCSEEYLVNFFKTKYSTLKDAEIDAIVKGTLEKLKIPNEDLLNEYIYRYFLMCFAGR